MFKLKYRQLFHEWKCFNAQSSAVNQKHLVCSKDLHQVRNHLGDSKISPHVVTWVESDLKFTISYHFQLRLEQTSENFKKFKISKFQFESFLIFNLTSRGLNLTVYKIILLTMRTLSIKILHVSHIQN